MKNSFKITGLILAVAGCFALAVFAQRESRLGLSAFAGASAPYPYGQSVVIGAGTTNLTNVLIVPADTWIANPAAPSDGAVPIVTFLDCNVATADNAAVATPAVTFFSCTNSYGVFAGDNAASDPKALAASVTNGTYHASTNVPGSGSNVYWLNGLAPGLITNQWVVIKHQGVLPIQNSVEAATLAWTNLQYYTNTWTNGAGTTMYQTNTNTVIGFMAVAGKVITTNVLQNKCNSGDVIYFMSTNGTIPIGTNNATGQRLTLNGPGIWTGDRNKPLLVLSRGSNAPFVLNSTFAP